MASGKGSNLEAILEASKKGMCPVNVALVLSNREKAGALAIARREGITACFINPADFPDRESFDLACMEAIIKSNAEWVILAGYMRILTPTFVDRFRNRIVNIHPSLLPAFPGAHAVSDALEYGVKMTGVTVHLVDEVLDGGPILAQEAVPVEEGDTVETLHARIQSCEHRLYPATIARLMEKPFRLDGRRVIWE